MTEQERKAFDAMRDALKHLAIIIVKHGTFAARVPSLDEVWQGRAALALAEEVSHE